jgi:two-component system CheB/CheR fusion protein
MLLNKQETLQDYARFLKDHTAEANALYKDLLINVTSFFRDPGSMDYLKKDLFPRILKRKNLTDPFRIWIPACSTGEEAYSVAMILFELLGDKATGSLVQIFATDLSETAIMKARQGLYSGSDMRDISPKRIQRFFTKTDGSYRIIKPIRDLCIFAPHNVFKDPPFSRIDFISCRNLLIYLDTILQKKLISTFDYSLKPGGF